MNDKNRLIINIKDFNQLDVNQEKILKSIFSDKVGIINAFLERYDLAEYGLHMYQSLTASAQILFDIPREVSSGGLGINFSGKQAIDSCIGESIERYCMSFCPDDELLYCRSSDFNIDSLNKQPWPFTIRQYSSAKFKTTFSNPFTDQLYWTKLTNYLKPKDFIYYPASLIYLPFKLQKPIFETTSTGVAAHNNYDDAVFAATLEVIERDALMLNFYQNLSPIEINITSVIESLSSEFLESVSKNYSIKLYKLYSDVNIPIYLCYIWRGEGKKIHYGIGACADISSSNAILKAVKECLFTFFYSKKMLSLKTNNRKNITKLYEHFLYYQGNRFASLLNNPFKKIDYFNEDYSRNYFYDELNKKGHNVYVKNLTTSDLEELPLKVVKVVIPGFIDLIKSHKFIPLGMQRFWSVPNSLGIKHNKKLSSAPHPFP